ncbi:MAG TPA: hypothetical protein V6D07_18925 [Trichocoleus sp.]
MNREEFKSLGPGDIVEGLSSGETYIVSANYGDRVTAVKTVDLTNPSEWKVVLKANHKPESQLE